MVNIFAQDNHITIYNNLNKTSSSFTRSDKKRCKQVILNLLTNAIKYNRVGGSVWIKLDDSSRDNFFKLKIIDDGLGIPQDTLKDIFEPFYRVNDPKLKKEGTGIGLTISKELVDLLGGVLGVESTLGKGSTFWVELPRASNVANMEDHKTVKINKIQKPLANGPYYTILYIENSSSNINLMEEIISQHTDHVLLNTRTVNMGIKLAIDKQPHLIFLDLNLPDNSSYEVLKELKSNKATEDIPVVAISSMGPSTETLDDATSGYVHHLIRPFAVNDVLEIILKHSKSIKVSTRRG